MVQQGDQPYARRCAQHVDLRATLLQCVTELFRVRGYTETQIQQPVLNVLPTYYTFLYFDFSRNAREKGLVKRQKNHQRRKEWRRNPQNKILQRNDSKVRLIDIKTLERLSFQQSHLNSSIHRTVTEKLALQAWSCTEHKTSELAPNTWTETEWRVEPDYISL